jgi:hypothetical protein
VTNATTVPGGLEARQPVPPPARTPAEIEADIEATRARLAGTVDAIAYRVKPANVARRGVRGLMSQVVDRNGNLRPDRVAVLAAVVGGAVGLVLWRRSR